MHMLSVVIKYAPPCHEPVWRTEGTDHKLMTLDLGE
jgi:hypothetical protein